ncbi:hypothetical protein [Desulfosporosinus nitroreducens]|uniref:hypothetical protein n=1 Tax=Desulfosporosinus nitroreducens TaxID=2018668 RepID=UPI00207C1BDA|nr:hypothetical protein [Desulfosporosinus nitroreducens]MCO1602801.1 hypothetical protein [Desulfosporosinus nitroreducens]
MNRRVLLIEPDYKNKYPPMGLMKLATYYRRLEDDVRFFKGNLKEFAARLLCEEFFDEVGDASLGKHFPKLIEHIKTGKYAPLDAIPDFRNSELERKIKVYRLRYKAEDFPKFDIVGITTLFTFYWSKTVDTINYAKNFCKHDGRMLVGGISSTILPDEIIKETGIDPHKGLLNAPGILDNDNKDIIDELPLDYSILDEIDYKYPANNAYFGYMTRGCVNKCEFCAVPRLEPDYKDYIALKQQIKETEERFGAQKDLLLMDNNVFASKCFDGIIDEIKECGFAKDATYMPPSEYSLAIDNLKANYNIRAYRKKMIGIYDRLSKKMSEEDAGDFYRKREKLNLLYAEVATKDNILAFDDTVRPLYDKAFRNMRRARYIDFNQGVDARLVTDAKMAKLSEINIRPLRIAFDHYSMNKVYIKAIKSAAKHGITDLSNYLLYNYQDKPEELYYRMRINIDLCEELGVTIYSFPMKYHPIDDPTYFRNRDYIGDKWNRKFIRAIQAVLNATKGKIGRGKAFFEEAFGKDIDEYNKILWMPEAFIIYRRKYDEELRTRLAEKYQSHYDDESNLVNEWWDKFNALDEKQLQVAKDIIARNRFAYEDIEHCRDKFVREVLEYYRIKRD